jgi:hypothetical protein
MAEEEQRLADEYADVLKAHPWGDGRYFDDDFEREPDVLAAIDAEIESVLHRLQEAGYLDRVRAHTGALGYERALLAVAIREGDLGIGTWAKQELDTVQVRERNAFDEGGRREPETSDDVTTLLRLRDLRDKWASGYLTSKDAN